jgi:flagellar basal body-associated protein FliL
MIDNMMGSGMMGGMGLLWVLVIVVLILAAAALVKYLFFNSGRVVTSEQRSQTAPGPISAR